MESPPLTPPRIYLVRMAVFLVLAGLIAFILYRQIFSAFLANPGLNALIISVMLIGAILAIRQVWRLFPEVRWVNTLSRTEEASSTRSARSGASSPRCAPGRTRQCSSTN